MARTRLIQSTGTSMVYVTHTKRANFVKRTPYADTDQTKLLNKDIFVLRVHKVFL